MKRLIAEVDYQEEVLDALEKFFDDIDNNEKIADYFDNDYEEIKKMDERDVEGISYLLSKELDGKIEGLAKNELQEMIADNLKDEVFDMLQNAVNTILETGGVKVSTYDLDEKDDGVGDVTRVEEEDIDIYNREKAFLYIDGEIIESGRNQSHRDLINQYIREHPMEYEDEDGETYIEENQEFDSGTIIRPDEGDVLERLNASEIAFGSVIGNIAFLNEYVENASVDDVVSVLKQKYDKVYFDNVIMNGTVKRVAKKRLAVNEEGSIVKYLLQKGFTFTYDDVLEKTTKENLEYNEFESESFKIKDNKFEYTVFKSPTECNTVEEELTLENVKKYVD